MDKVYYERNVYIFNPIQSERGWKEVRKKMAIDYKEEWDKLSHECGAFGVNIPHEAVSVTLRSMMENQISNTIESREKLMQEYVREGVGTEIVGGEAAYYTVKIIVRGHMRGCISISKQSFRDWLKNRKKGGK